MQLTVTTLRMPRYLEVQFYANAPDDTFSLSRLEQNR